MDVDYATRILNTVSSDIYQKLDESQKKSLILKFCNIPENQKPISFRSISFIDIGSFFSKLNPALKKLIEIYYSEPVISIAEDSNNNKIGSDLFVTTKSGNFTKTRRVELKFGAETNRNIGNGAMDEIFEITDKITSFSSIFKNISAQQKKFMTGNLDNTTAGYTNLEKLLLEAATTLENLYDNGFLSINSEKMYTLLTTTGSLSNQTSMEDLMKIRVDFTYDFENSLKIMDRPNVSGSWSVSRIGMAENSIRVEIRTSNAIVSTKFLLNWKNNYNFKGVTYPAKLGLGSSSWNVWIYL